MLRRLRAPPRVSVVAADFLDSVFDLPVVDLSKANPTLYQANNKLQVMHQYRSKLIRLKVGGSLDVAVVPRTRHDASLAMIVWYMLC